jgi:hypothetical protein
LLAAHTRTTNQEFVMEALITVMPTLAVSVVFCIWSAYRRASLQQRRRLHERVAYMLWIAAFDRE